MKFSGLFSVFQALRDATNKQHSKSPMTEADGVDSSENFRYYSINIKYLNLLDDACNFNHKLFISTREWFISMRFLIRYVH